jgi:hypothetical protein
MARAVRNIMILWNNFHAIVLSVIYKRAKNNDGAKENVPEPFYQDLLICLLLKL